MRAPRAAGATSAFTDDRLPRGSEGLEVAFEALYRRHRERVLRLCRTMLGHQQDAEEATQATMLSAYRALERGDRPGVVGAWLTTIARNECRDVIGRRQTTVPLPALLPSASPGPAEVVERRERMDELKRDLAELPRGQRTALVLRGMAGMPHADIARVVGGSEQGARTLVHEARESLAEFAEGRALECSVVRERIDCGDGRALRARRVRAHLRVCDDCSAAAGRRRGRLAGLLPPPALLAAIRGVFAGSPAGPVAGGAALVSLVAAGALVVPGPWSPGPAARASDAPAAFGGVAPGTLLPTSITSPAGATVAGPARSRPAGARLLPPGAPGGTAGTSPAGSAVTPAAAGGAPAAPAAGAPGGSGAAGSGAASGASTAGSGGGSGPPVTVRVTAPGSGGGGGVDVTVPAVTVPPVSVPPITVPSVATPPISTPPITVPPLPVGPISTPPITVPQITVPSVVTPPVTTPQVSLPPAVSTPPIGPVPPVAVTLEGVPRVTIGTP